MWLLSIAGLDAIDVFFEGGISALDEVAQKLPVLNFEMSLLPYRSVILCQIIQGMTPVPPRFCSFFSLFVDNIQMINP